MAALRAVLAVFGAFAGLDGQQAADLYPVGVEIGAVNLLGLIEQVEEGQGEQGLDSSTAQSWRRPSDGTGVAGALVAVASCMMSASFERGVPARFLKSA